MLQDLVQFSALSKLNTGNVVVDFLAILFFGFALKIIQNNDIAFNVLRYFRFDVVRTIKHTKHVGIPHYLWAGDSENEVLNNVLINAIVYYINRSIPVKFKSSDIYMLQLPHTDKGVDTMEIMFVPGQWDWTYVCTLRGCKVWIMRVVDDIADEVNNKTVRSVTEKCMIRATRVSSSGDMDGAIEEFIGRAHDAYKSYIKTRTDKDARYYHTCVRGKDEDGVECVLFKKYKLSSNKHLEHVCHPSVPKIRSVLNDMLNSCGKFAVEGHSKKATFLLHGPPGTGKTSLIKAIANYTKRHIISVNLANIQTSQELMDVMFSDRIGNIGSDSKVKNEDVIFVMEDIDAACDIVKDRDAPVVVPKSDKEFLVAPKDPLTLATILNVLDGALECDNRIIILTTNYVDRLDKALVRPGRITLNVEMTFIKGDSACCMINRYFPDEMTPIQEVLVMDFLEQKDITPAELEMMCSYCDNVEEVLDAIQKRP